MNSTKLFYMFFILLLITSGTFAQDSSKAIKGKKPKEHGHKFVDADGDGYNDNAPDHDGDGIPNGLDADYLKLKRRKHQQYIDLDGDGINDNLQFNGKYQGQLRRSTKLNIRPQSGNKDNGGENPYDKGDGNGEGNSNGNGHGNGHGRGQGRG